MSRARRGLGRRQRRHPTVGYGHPPEAHRFTPGRSGNPRGRPKSATAHTPAQQLKRLTQLVLKEASRPIPLRGSERSVTVPMAQAIVSRVAVDAVKGDPRAQRLFTTLLTLSEDEAQDEAQRTAEQASEASIIKVVFVRRQGSPGR